MTVRHCLLAILAEGPCYGHQLRQEFDRRTGSSWSINAGQVYQTLDRLQRDKLIEAAGVDSEGRELYAVSAAGRKEVERWFASSTVRDDRDELAIKLALAVTLPHVDAVAVIESQRVAAQATLEEAAAVSSLDVGAAIIASAQRERAEADLRWLDDVERLLAGTSPYGLNAESPRRGRPAKPTVAEP